MIKALFDNQAIYIIVASIAGIGLLFRVLELMAFRSMVARKDKNDQSKKTKPTTFLTALKTDYTKKYLTGKKVNNVDAFVDKYMRNREFCGLSIIAYKKMCGLTMIGTVSITALLSIWAGVNNLNKNVILSTILTGVICVTLLMIVDCFVGFEDRLKKHKANIVYYIENEYFYYISSEENVKNAATQTLASRQKKILMKEKEMAEKEDVKKEEAKKEEAKDEKLQKLEETIKTMAKESKEMIDGESEKHKEDKKVETTSQKQETKVAYEEEMVEEILKGLLAQ